MFTHSTRRLIARIGIAALLFAQTALAAYACPVTAGPAETLHAAMAEDAHTAMPGCDESKSDGASLCLQHCQASGWSVQATPQPPVEKVALLPVVFIEPTPPAREPAPTALAALLERATSPPPLLRFCVLRI
jgi:hypothetical protein